MILQASRGPDPENDEVYTFLVGEVQDSFNNRSRTCDERRAGSQKRFPGREVPKAGPGSSQKLLDVANGSVKDVE
jgi:hypothetical protein